MTKPIINAFTPFEVPSIQRYKSYLPNAFDETLTILQKVNKVIKTLELLGEVSADVVAQWNEVMTWVMDEGLNDSIIDKINGMIADGSLATILNETIFNTLNMELDAKSDLAYVESKFTSIVSGSPKGVYSSLNALQNAYPSGNTGVYVTTDNGNWYYWNTINNVWTSGGVYQGTVTPANSITSDKRSVLGEWGQLITTQSVNIDSVNKKLIFPSSGYIGVQYRKTNVPLSSLLNAQISLDTPSGSVFIVFDTVSNTILTYELASSLSEQHLFLGWIIWGGSGAIVLNGNFTFDGVTYLKPDSVTTSRVKDQAITTAKRTPLGDLGTLITGYPVNIDTKTKTLNFQGGYIGLGYRDVNINVSSTYANTSYNFNTDSASFLYFDTLTNTLKTAFTLSTLIETDVLIGWIFWDTFSMYFNMNYTVDGRKLGSVSRWSMKTLVALGDSTTWGDNGLGTGSNSISWASQLPKLNGFKTVINSGVKGSTIAIQSGRTDSFVERYSSLDNSADLITVFGGVNDKNKNIPLGTATSTDNNTFYGALNNLITGLINKYPSKLIVFITPMKTAYSTNETFTPNSVGLTLKDYRDAILNRCDYYNLPVLDLYSNLGMSPYVTSQASLYFGDGLHPTEDGYKRVASRIAGFLETV
jgi:lysophospholipase L1-like esterase